MSYNLRKISAYTAYMGLFFLAACTQSNPPFTGVKIGKPYEINGKVYRPAPDSSYDKIGDASWYGPGFDGKRTASGEIFDQDDITAAHPTLPIPSLVRVTNLSNEKSIVVRVNDRGPFHSNRIIDLSKRTAELIDVRSVKPVRVQFLAEETEAYIASIQGISPRIDMVAYNENYNKKMKEKSDSMVARMDAVNSAPNFNNSEIQNFAPVQSVSSNDLEKHNKPEVATSNFLVKSAMADENTISPEQATLYKQAIQKPAVQKAIPEAKQSVNITIKDEPSSKKSNDRYIILAGSFASQTNAKKLVDSLDSIDNHEKLIVVDRVEVSGKEWWRVHIGPFTDRDKAEKALKIVHDTGTRDARISRKK